jgi:hypothetical protein
MDPLRSAIPIARIVPHQSMLITNVDHCGGFMGAVAIMMTFTAGGPRTRRPTVREGTVVQRLARPTRVNPRIVVRSVRK